MENQASSQQSVTTTLLASIAQELRKPDYLSTILPNNFSYFIQLIEYGKNTQQKNAYFQSVFRIFTNMLKGTQYTNAYVFSNTLAQFPDLLKDYFVLYKTQNLIRNKYLFDMEMFERYQEAVTALLHTTFKSQYEQLQQDPEKFLDSLAYQIVLLAEEEVSIEQLRHIIMRFLETGLSKLVWSPDEKEKTWELVKTISHNLAKLTEYNIIDDSSDLDDLFWTLIYRYCFFLDVTSTDISITLYEIIKNDIANQHLLLFELEEQESFLETKANYVLRNVLASEAKKRAHDQGILINN